MVSPADNTLTAIKKKVRRVTATSGASALSEDDLEEYINDFYNNDFPAAIKTDQMRGVYTFFTAKNQPTYPLDINYNQSVRGAVYFEGVQGNLFKSRQDFFRIYPRFPTKNVPESGDGITKIFSFTIGGAPLLQKEVVIGTISTGGTSIQINDDGKGTLYLQTPNPQVSNPLITSTKPGMYNLNTGNPGQNIQESVGTVNYLTGAITFDLTGKGLIPASGEEIVVWTNQYQPGKPYSLLFWNNEFNVRPVPDGVYKVEVETYMTPVQFLEVNDHPIVNQWWQYIALGAALRYLQDIQDMEGVENVRGMFLEQEALVLERQANEEINSRNNTIYSQPAGSSNRFNPYWFY